MRLSIRYIAIFTLALSLALIGQAQAISVAVFPVDDLSKDSISTGRELNNFFAAEVYKKGLEVIDYEKILAFMSERRVRHFGFLETHEIMATRESLGVDLVILASICQQNEKSGTLGLSLSLVRTSDGRTIWANSNGVSLLDQQRILGINSPTTFDDLLPILARKLFLDWPADLDLTAGRELADEQIAAVKDSTAIQVESVFFSPKFVKPGEEVKCTIRFKSRDGAPVGAKIFVKVGNRVYLASSDDGIYYKAAWFSPAGSRGEQIQVASINNDSLILKGVWTGDAKDANYPVSLILDWPTGKREESYLGSYVVDSIAPEISFKLHGKVVDGIVSFRKKLPVSVRFIRNEPIEKWQFIITDSDGNKIRNERGRGAVPAKLVWDGRKKNNTRANNGTYSLSLKIWDRAGNTSVTTEKVTLLDMFPEVEVAIVEVDSKIIAILSSQDHIPVTSWRMQLWTANNILLTTLTGDTLPAKVTLVGLAESVDKDAIFCRLEIRDSLGNRSKKEIHNLLAQAKSSASEVNNLTEDETKNNEWQTDF